MKIAIGTDHAGYALKEKIKRHLTERGHQVLDMGTNSEESVDYPKFIFPAAVAVAEKRAERGIVLGGSGNGEAIAANRVRGVRCALCWSEETARLGRGHNDANVISIGARLTPHDLALRIVDIWLETPFEGGRHAGRVQQLDQDPPKDPPK